MVKRLAETNFYNLTKSIQSITALFPDSSRPTGEKSETFTSRLNPIIEQIEILGIAKDQGTSVLYSLCPAKTPARKVCEKLKLKLTTIEDMFEDVKKMVFSMLRSRTATRPAGTQRPASSSAE